MRVYYHPSVGDYARYPSFEWDYALAGAGISGVGVGAGCYALRATEAYPWEPNGGSLLWGLAGALVGGGIAGALMPKRILSWFNPPPFDAPIRYPRQIPKVVVPSFIGESGQVLNLLMHHGAGSVVRDYSDFGNHGRIYGAKWVDGPWGWALGFDGTDDRMEVPNAPELNPVNELTILAWIKRSMVDECHAIVSKGGWSTSGAYTLRIERENRIMFIASDGSASTGEREGGYVDTQWHLVGAQFDNGVIRFILDGDIIKEETTAIATIGSNTKPVYIGCAYWLANFMNGIIALPRIYNRALTPEEIRYHFESTRAIFGV